MSKQVPRPFLNLGIDELEALFSRDATRETLLKLQIELKYRRVPRAVGLLRRVEATLAGPIWTEARRKSGEPLDPAGAAQPLEPLAPEEIKRVSAQTVEIDELAEGPEAIADDKTDEESSGERDTPVGTGGRQLSLFDEFEETVPPHKERRGGKIRGVGPLPDVPVKWTPEPKTDYSPNWTASDPTLKRYEAALRALITELRNKSTSGQQVQLQDGHRVAIEGEDAAYQFAWSGDKELFEGASVMANADGHRVRGRLVSITPQQLIVALEEGVGDRIRHCTLFIDNTAMLEALANRLKDIAEQKPAGFNVDLAEDVLANRSKAAPPGEISAEFLDGLRPLQKDAVRMAAGNTVTYLWGPPGTGKTLTLSALVRHFFAAGKRVLLASNTNQAVDQVLRKLCNALTNNGQRPLEQVEMLEQGKIVRVGKAGDELRVYQRFVTIPGIVERRSVELRRQKTALEAEEAAELARSERARAVVAAFELLDRAKKELEAARISLRQTEAGLAALILEQQRLETKKADLIRELSGVEGAGALRRAFMRSAVIIRAEIADVDLKIFAGASAISAGKERVSYLRAEIIRINHIIDGAAAVIATRTRQDAQAEIDRAENSLAEIRRRIAEIDRQLADIEKSILANAQVVGATATRLFLSSNLFSGFEVVVLDKASMLLLPAIFHAAGMAKDKVIVSGDFRQLPPILQSDQKAIRDEIGPDIFRVAGIEDAFDRCDNPKRAIMLEEQFRMADPICRLVSTKMYEDRLHTAAGRHASSRSPPYPFEGPLTIVDTSYIGPVVAKDPVGSKFNLMNALVVKNLCQYLNVNGFATNEDIGVAVPYRAQRKLVETLLIDAGLRPGIVGTVHHFQGNEKRLMIVDLVDGLGLKLPGLWLQADNAREDGAKLFNVAISRAQDHLIFIGDLSWLDRKLPERAFLRDWLHKI